MKPERDGAPHISRSKSAPWLSETTERASENFSEQIRIHLGPNLALTIPPLGSISKAKEQEVRGRAYRSRNTSTVDVYLPPALAPTESRASGNAFPWMVHPILVLSAKVIRLQSKLISLPEEERETGAKAILDCLDFLSVMDFVEPTPEVGMSDDGEISLQWLFDSKRAIVIFEGDGAFEYAMLAGDSFRAGQFEVDRANWFPEDLKTYLID